VIADTNLTGTLLLVLGGLLVLLTVVVLFLRHRTKGERPEVPYAMRPGPSDVALETPLLQKLQGWGVVLVVFLVVWFPLLWLVEPDRNLVQEEDLRVLAVERGALAVNPFSEENQLGVGCVRCHGPELAGGVITTADGYASPPSLQTICGGNLLEGAQAHPKIATLYDIYQVIYEGRIASGMPSWSIRYEGALTDQQINDIVMYLVELSSEYVPEEDNICTNPDAEQRALDKAVANGDTIGTWQTVNGPVTVLEGV
jgi:mono/diheme cytochrome c family protein